MSEPEAKMKSVVEVNEMVKLYAAVVAINMSQSVITCKEQLGEPTTHNAERSTIQLLDEYADCDRRTNNLIIHNISESNVNSLAERNENDMKRVMDILNDGLNIDSVKITKTIHLRGRGQNRATKPKLVLATMGIPARKRVIPAASKSLRDR